MRTRRNRSMFDRSGEGTSRHLPGFLLTTATLLLGAGTVHGQEARAPRSADATILALGVGSEGGAFRMLAGATPWAIGPIALGVRGVVGGDGRTSILRGPRSHRLLAALMPRAAVGLELGSASRIEAGLALGAAAWRSAYQELPDADVERERRISPAGELSTALLFGKRFDIGPELRGEIIGIHSFAFTLGLRIGGPVFD
jgi:hypothetical protein